MPNGKERGLYNKYDVYRHDGDPINWAFVLEDCDPMIVAPLAAYAARARAAGYALLADDLDRKVRELAAKFGEDKTPSAPDDAKPPQFASVETGRWSADSPPMSNMPLSRMTTPVPAARPEPQLLWRYLDGGRWQAVSVRRIGDQPCLYRIDVDVDGEFAVQASDNALEVGAAGTCGSLAQAKQLCLDNERQIFREISREALLRNQQTLQRELGAAQAQLAAAQQRIRELESDNV